MAYGARLESVLGASPRGFESPILRHDVRGAAVAVPLTSFLRVEHENPEGGPRWRSPPEREAVWRRLQWESNPPFSAMS